MSHIGCMIGASADAHAAQLSIDHACLTYLAEGSVRGLTAAKLMSATP